MVGGVKKYGSDVDKTDKRLETCHGLVMTPNITFTEAELAEAQAIKVLLEGASMLCMMAATIETACDKAPKDFVVMKKANLMGIARSQRLAASMIDLLALAVERGDSLAKAMGVLKT